MSRPANDVVVVTLDGESLIALNAPGEDHNGAHYRAARIAEKPGHIWLCEDREASGCRYVIPPHAVMRVWVRSLSADA